MEIQNVDMIEAIAGLSAIAFGFTELLKRTFPKIDPRFWVYLICGSIGALYGIMTSVMAEDVIARVSATFIGSVWVATLFYRTMKAKRQPTIEEVEEMYKRLKKLKK